MASFKRGGKGKVGIVPLVAAVAELHYWEI